MKKKTIVPLLLATIHTIGCAAAYKAGELDGIEKGKIIEREFCFKILNQMTDVIKKYQEKEES